MNLAPILFPLILAIVIGFIFGRVQGEHAGIRSVVDQVRGTGRCFTSTEVVVGQVVSWEKYETNQIKVGGTVDGVPVESRNANSKHEAKTVISGTEGYRHPFLCRESDA